MLSNQISYCYYLRMINIIYCRNLLQEYKKESELALRVTKGY